MKQIVFLALLAVAALAVRPDFFDQYNEEQVFQCTLATQEDVNALDKIREIVHMDIWSHHLVPGSQFTVRVNRNEKDLLTSRFECTTFIENVAHYLKEEEHLSVTHKRKRGLDADWFDEYHPLEDIIQWVKDQASNHSDIATFVPSIGKSHEGRDIVVIRIKAVPEPPRTIFFSGCIHAREWISPATVQYFIHKLLNTNDTTTSFMLEQFEFVIAPCINPDGYAFSWSDDRLWRKNRRARSENGGICYGVDLNRNFNNHWGGTGASASPCAEDYRGPSVASEPETTAVQNYVLTLKRRSAAIDFHAYGQLILRSYGYTVSPSPNESVLKQVGDGMAAVIKAQSGASYTSQRAAQLYPTTGSTDDWYTEQAGMWGWTIELRDTGRYGFRLPADQIKPTGEEIWAAMAYFTQEVAARGPISN